MSGPSTPGMRVMRDVVLEQLAAHSEIQSSSDDHVDVVHRLRRETRPVAPATRREMLVEAVQVIGPQAPQRYVTDRRIDVAVDEPRVSVGGRRPERLALERQPCGGQEPAELDRSTPWGRNADLLAVEAVREVLGLPPVVAHGVPSPSFLARQGV